MPTIFGALYQLAVKISPKLPLGYDLPLDMPILDIQTIAPAAKPRDGEIIAVVGKKGTGKTTFNKALIDAKVKLRPYLNVYHVDSKKQGDFSSKDGKIYKTYEPPPPLTGEGMRQVWQPVTDDPLMYRKYFEQILAVGKPAIVDVDETVNLKCGKEALLGFEILAKQGRKPGIDIHANTQEIAQAPRQMFSQADEVIGFRVWNDYDERMLMRYLRLPTKGHLPLSGKHSFLHLKVDVDGQPTLFNDYRDFIKKHVH